ncbi:MAG: YdeI/OmpD-associated family protein, partial [Mycobacterium sp.]
MRDSGAMEEETPELIVHDARAWRRWLGANNGGPAGVWLVLAKKGTREPTSLTYDEALEEALCQGWIDGRKGRRDEATYRLRFTPRRARSPWSKRNVLIAERLIDQGRMEANGRAEIERARADGRWDRAYAGQATIEVPDDLKSALAHEPRAKAMFEVLNGQNRYAVLYRIHSAKRDDTRARRIDQYVTMLARGETIYPQEGKVPRSTGRAG